MVSQVTGMIDRLRSFVEQRLVPYYQALAQREQRLVAGSALFLAIMLPLFGVVLPLEDARKAMFENVKVLKSQAAEAERLADQLQSGGQVSITGNVMSEVDRIARSSGVREFMTRIRPQAGIGGNKGLMVQMKNAPYREIISFVSAIADKGLGFSRMKLQAADTSGHVHLQAVISGGS